MRQIFLNLLGNSVKFTEEGFILIRCSVKNETKDKIEILFEVEDSGIGVSKDKQDLIFESFTQSDSSITRKFGGTGLGLTITKKLITKMGGSIGVRSEENKGSNFYFTISFEKSHEVKVNKKEESVKSDETLGILYPFKILLVEDIQVNQKVASKFLSRLGYTVSIANNGKEALAFVLSNPVDLIFMDIGMPEMDGMEATREIRLIESTKHIIIAMTANVEMEDRNKYLSDGMDDFISKPIYFEELAKKIKDWGETFFAK